MVRSPEVTTSNSVINMDKFDRSIQRETLQLLYVYPNELTNEQVNEIAICTLTLIVSWQIYFTSTSTS
jgi:hypothetical protein